MRLIGILCMSSEAECITSRAPERQADKHGGATPVYYTSRSVGVKGGGGGGGNQGKGKADAGSGR